MLKGTTSGVARRTLSILLLTGLLGTLLGGCASNTNAPVVDRKHRGQPAARQQAVRPVTSGSYVVRPKDTLYSIAFRFGRDRSEEHTSELQSRPHLVCRLLLEKKKHCRSERCGRHRERRHAPDHT